MTGSKVALALICLDEPAAKVTAKYAACLAGERVAEMSGDYPPALQRLKARLQELDAFVRIYDGRDGANVDVILDAFLKEVPAGRVPVAVFDHLHLLDASAVEERDPEAVVVSKVTDAVLGFARKRGGISIAISEITKASINPEVARAAPLAAFAGSRRIASRFDAALLLLKTGERESEVIVAKSRFGRVSSFGAALNIETWRLTTHELGEAAAEARQKLVEERLAKVIYAIRASGPLSVRALERAVKGSKAITEDARELGLSRCELTVLEGPRGAMLWALPGMPVPPVPPPSPDRPRGRSSRSSDPTVPRPPNTRRGDAGTVDDGGEGPPGAGAPNASASGVGSGADATGEQWPDTGGEHRSEEVEASPGAQAIEAQPGAQASADSATPEEETSAPLEPGPRGAGEGPAECFHELSRERPGHCFMCGRPIRFDMAASMFVLESAPRVTGQDRPWGGGA